MVRLMTFGVKSDDKLDHCVTIRQTKRDHSYTTPHMKNSRLKVFKGLSSCTLRENKLFLNHLKRASEAKRSGEAGKDQYFTVGD